MHTIGRDECRLESVASRDRSYGANTPATCPYLRSLYYGFYSKRLLYESNVADRLRLAVKRNSINKVGGKLISLPPTLLG